MSENGQEKIDKQVLRSRFLSMRKALSTETVEQRSSLICDHIEGLIKEKKVILFYMPVNREVDVLPLSLKLFKKGYKILFPRVVDDSTMEVAAINDPEWDFEKGSFNIPEPKTPVYTGAIDLILVPGVVFDAKGHRIGYGKGYYDRFLAQHREVRTVGVAFRFQVIPRLPVVRHDIPLRGLVTEDGYKKIS